MKFSSIRQSKQQEDVSGNSSLSYMYNNLCLPDEEIHLLGQMEIPQTYPLRIP